MDFELAGMLCSLFCFSSVFSISCSRMSVKLPVSHGVFQVANIVARFITFSISLYRAKHEGFQTEHTHSTTRRTSSLYIITFQSRKQANKVHLQNQIVQFAFVELILICGSCQMKRKLNRYACFVVRDIWHF